MNRNEPKQNYWYLIPAELVEEGKFGKALLYGLIWSLTNKEGFCWASNKYLAKKLHRKDESIIRTYLTELDKDDWIKIKDRNSKKRKIYPLINPIQRVEKTTGFLEPVEKIEETRGKNPVKPVENSTQSNIISIYNKYKYIYDYWNTLKLKQNKEPTVNKNKSIIKILKKCSWEEIKKAMENYSIVIKEESYFYEYQWTMENFLNREKGIGYFLDDGEKWINYMTWKSKQIKTDPDEILKRKRLSQDEAQKKRDQDRIIKAEEVKKFQEKTGGVLNLTEEIEKKINE